MAAETRHYVVLDKPAGLDCQDSRVGRTSVVAWLRGRYGFAGLVHRLDFNTSGLLVCAKNPEEAARLVAMLGRGEIGREYLAVALGRIFPEEGVIESPIDGRPARTAYRVAESLPNASLLGVSLETGRKHQIRRHLAQAGHPLLGDHRYGSQAAKILFHRPALHAAALTVGSERFESPLPEDMKKLLERLRARQPG